MHQPSNRLLLPAAVFVALVLGGAFRSEGPSAGGKQPTNPARGASPQPFPVSLGRVRRSRDDAMPALRGFQPPVFFDRNDGQVDRGVLYTAHGLGYSIFLIRSGAIAAWADAAKPKNDSVTRSARHFSLAFLGANPGAEVVGESELPGKSNYFSGSDARLWHTNVPQFARVRYRNLYPGVDAVFYFRHGGFEYDLQAAPGANLGAIRIGVDGAEVSRISRGRIALRSGAAEFDFQRPRVFQPGATPHLVHAAYSVHGSELSFSLTGYDPSRPLVIDPALIFATYLNSNCTGCTDLVNDVAADKTGVYIGGSTTASSFPATAGVQPTPQGYESSFVLKLDPTGTRIVYADYLASSRCFAVAVDAAGSAYLSGFAYVPTPSTVPPFPVTQGVFSDKVVANSAQFEVAYAAKLSADGAAVVYSTFLQQPTSDGSPVQNPQQLLTAKIAVDSSGALYIAGNQSPWGGSSSPVWLPLPVTQGAYQASPGSAFVMKLSPNASGLVYSTYFDGTLVSSDRVDAVAIDASGDAFLAGLATSGFRTTSGAYQTSNPAPPGMGSTFVFELNSSGTAPVYSTYVGSSSGSSEGDGIAVDGQGEAILGGTGVNPPVTANALCGQLPGFPSLGYVAKLNSAGTGLVYSTTLCSVDSQIAAVAVDSTGASYATGAVEDPGSFEPFLRQAIKSYFDTDPSTHAPEIMQVALKLDASGSLQWATFLGVGSLSGSPAPSRMAIDPSGAVYALYDSADFPTTPGAVGLSHFGLSATSGTTGNGFLVKIASSLGAPVGLAGTTAVSFPSQNVGSSSAPIDVEAGNYGDAAMTPTISISGDFSEQDNCAAGVAAGEKCDVDVSFTPTATGARSGTLNFSFGGLYPTETASLTGSGTQPAASLSPTSLSFGEQANGTTSGAQQVVLTNTGTGPLTVSSIRVSGEFSETNTCGGAIAPGISCTLQVTFTPTASGSQMGVLTITDNAPGSPQTVSLAGNQPPTFSLSSGSSSASASVTAGQTATFNLSLAPANGFTGSVNFGCTGAPSESTCSINPNPANITGASSVAVTVSVATQAAGTLIPPGPTPSVPLAAFEYALAALALSAILLACVPASQRKLSWKTAASAIAILFLLVTAVACGGGPSQPPPAPPSPGTPAGTYSIAVNGASGSISQSIQLTLKVN